MFESVNVGLIRESRSKKYMEWTINNYFSIPQEKNPCIESPSFSFCDEMWYLVIYPCGENTTDCAGWVGIYLKKQYPTTLKKAVSFKIGLKTLQAKYRSYKGLITSEGTLCWGTPKLCKQFDLINDNSTVVPNDVLTVFCTLQVSNNMIIELSKKTRELSKKTSSIKEKIVAGIDRTLKFKPVIGRDTTIINGVSTDTGTRLQCITVMKEFENKSLEELRLADYASGHQRTENLDSKLPIKESSGVQSDAITPNVSKSSSATKNRKFVKPARRSIKRTVVDVKQQAILPGVTAKESTAEIKFGSNFEFKPVTESARINTMPKTMIQFYREAFDSTSGQKHDKNTANGTEDSGPPFIFGSSSQEGSTLGISQNQTTSGFCFDNTILVKSSSESTEKINKNAASETEDSGASFALRSSMQESSTINVEAMNEGEIVHKIEKDFEMIDFNDDVSEGLNKLAEDLKKLYVNGEDTGMILKVQDKEFKIHKTILMARSPVFATMFRHDMVEKNGGLVEITDCESDVFQEFLLYLYTGKVEKISFDRVTRLYQVADKYDVQLLKSLCVKFMMRNLCLENFCDVLSLALQFKESTIVENATDFFVENIKIIIATAKWLNFQKENPVEANELHIKALDCILPS